MAHRWWMHGTEPKTDWNQLLVSQTEHIPQVFDFSFLKGTSQCQCPFPSFQGHRGTGTSYRTILTANTGGGVSGSCRSTPPHFPNAGFVGVRYHLGASGTGIMIPKNAGLGSNDRAYGQHYNTALGPVGFR